MSVRDRLQVSGAEDVAESFLSLVYHLGLVSLSMAGVGALAMLHITWVEILHTSGAIEQIGPAGVFASEAITGIPMAAITGGVVFYGVDAILTADYDPLRWGVIVAGAYAQAAAVYTVLLSTGVIA